MSWGTELWDRYDAMSTFTLGGIDFLDNTVANFVKERGKLEGEYAKNLRSLIKRFTPKGCDLSSALSSESYTNSGGEKKLSTAGRGTFKSNGTYGKSTKGHSASVSGPTSLSGIKIRTTSEEDEFSSMLAYKQMLREVGYIAGQHEVLADSFSKDNYRYVHDQCKKLREIRKQNIKEYERHQHDLKLFYKSMEAAKEKFRKSFEEQERACQAYKSANTDNNVTKNEVEKLRLQASVKTQQCDALKCQYANIMLKTNDARSRYYGQLLPAVLGELQKLEQTRIVLARDCIREMVGKEREVAPILSKCHQSIEDALEAVNGDADAETAVDKFKTGDVPPGEFRFEDIRDPHALLNQDTLAENRPSNLNLYPRKRELERQIEATGWELQKSQRELESILKMANTYEAQPKFGKSDEFRGEIETVRQRIEELEETRKVMKVELANVEARLESLRSRSPHLTPGNGSSGPGMANNGNAEINSPMLNALQRNIAARSGSFQSVKSNSSLSIGSSSGGSSSSSSYPPKYPHYEQTDYYTNCSPDSTSKVRPVTHVDYVDRWSEDYEAFPSPPPPTVKTPVVLGGNNPEVCEEEQERLRGQQDQRFFSSASSETSNDSSTMGGGTMKRCEALYDYRKSEDNNISMKIGDQFIIVEDECDGWTRVRRLVSNGQDEGYVPSSYLKIL